MTRANTKSHSNFSQLIGQFNILNIEKGEWGIDRMQCNLIENEGKSTDYSQFLMSVSTILCGIGVYMAGGNPSLQQLFPIQIPLIFLRFKLLPNFYFIFLYRQCPPTPPPPPYFNPRWVDRQESFQHPYFNSPLSIFGGGLQTGIRFFQICTQLCCNTTNVLAI